MNTKEIQQQIKSLKDMIQSCHVYGGAEKSTYNFERYILPYREKVGADIFEEIYEDHVQYLKNNFEIQANVYQDSDGLTYNSLVKK